MELKDKIIEKLKTVIDPETGIDVINMGLVKDLEVFEDGKVSLKFQPSSPICPLGFQLAFSIKKAVEEMKEVENVNLEAIDFVYAEKLNQMLKE